MNLHPIERVRKMNSGEAIDRVPFMPTLYEHCASLIDKTPSQVAQSKELLIKSQITAYEAYRHDLVTVGLDIYNVEVEALGGNIIFPENNEIPGLKGHPLADNDNLNNLNIPDPEKDSRMPLFLEAAEAIKREIGEEVLVNGTIVGPFTLAALLRGFENFIMDLMTRPEYAQKLMKFSAEVGISYGEAMIKRGLGLSINESWISPPLISPKIYKEHILKWEGHQIAELKTRGLSNIGLISGGNTTPIVDQMLTTGTSLIMADYNCDLKYFKEKAEEAGVILRGCIDSKLLEKGSREDIYNATNKVLDIGSTSKKFVIGCGVVSYNTPKNQLLLFKKAVEDYYKHQ